MGFFRKTGNKNEMKSDMKDNNRSFNFSEESNAETVVAAISSELLAVISAAIVSMEKRPGFRLEVKNVRRVPSTSPVWNTAGRAERMLRNLNA